MSEDVVVEADLPDSPDKVWRALTEPALLEAWLPEAAGCELLDAEPGERLRYAWPEADGVASEVAFTLTPNPGGGVRLRIVHSAVVVSLSAVRARRSAMRLGGFKWAA